MFALAMFAFEGRGGPRNTAEGARLLTEAANLGHTAANYDLGLLYLQGQEFKQDFARAAELLRVAANAKQPGSAIRARNHVTRKVAACPRSVQWAMALMLRASIAGYLDAMVEFAIAQFNGNGTDKDEAAAARLFLTAARRAAPSRRTGWRAFSWPGAACRPIRSRRSAGTSSPAGRRRRSGNRPVRQ